MKAHQGIDHLSLPEQTALQDFLGRLQQQFPRQILAVTLFGSRARGEAQADSDVDLVVIIPQEDKNLCHAIRNVAADVSLEYGLYLSTRVWSLAHWQRLAEIKTGLYRGIQSDGITLSLEIA